MGKYDKFDAELLRCISIGMRHNAEIDSDITIKKLAHPHEFERNQPRFRIIDGRLQALRKAGKITYLGPKHGWNIVKGKEK